MLSSKCSWGNGYNSNCPPYILSSFFVAAARFISPSGNLSRCTGDQHTIQSVWSTQMTHYPGHKMNTDLRANVKNCQIVDKGIKKTVISPCQQSPHTRARPDLDINSSFVWQRDKSVYMFIEVDRYSDWLRVVRKPLSARRCDRQPSVLIKFIQLNLKGNH